MESSILLLLVTVGLLVMMTMSRRRQAREQQQVQSQLAPGREVMTSSGLFATVVSVADGEVVLQTGPGQQSRWDRRAVVRVLDPLAEGSDSLSHQDPEHTASGRTGEAGSQTADGGPDDDRPGGAAGDTPEGRG